MTGRQGGGRDNGESYRTKMDEREMEERARERREEQSTKVEVKVTIVDIRI